MASNSLKLVFRCTLMQLSGAAQRALGLRNLIDPDSIIENLLHTIPNSDAIQTFLCTTQEVDPASAQCTVTLLNYVEPDSGRDRREPSDPAEFHKAAKALQELIFIDTH